MTLFVDTSASWPSSTPTSPATPTPSRLGARQSDDRDRLVTSNYVPVEVVALVQRRLGFGALRALAGDLLPLVETL